MLNAITKLTISSYIASDLIMNIRALILYFAVLVIGLSACKKENGDLVPVVNTTNLNVINASADTLNFYQNGTRLNNTSNLYPFGSLGYMSVAVGSQNYQFKRAGSSDALVGKVLALDTAVNYTLFVAGETPDKVFLLNDVFPVDSTITVSIRFVNASPMAANVDVYIGDKFNYKNQAFKSATPFVGIASGKNALSIYEAGTTNLLAGGTLTLVAGNSYTLFIKGVPKGTGNNVFGARIITTR